MNVMFAFFIVHVFSISGIGSFIGGFFVKEWFALLCLVTVMAFLDAGVRYVYRGAGLSLLSFGGPFMYALAAAATMGTISFLAARRIRKNKTNRGAASRRANKAGLK